MMLDEPETPVERIRAAGTRSASARDLLAVGLSNLETGTAEAEIQAVKIIRTGGQLTRIAELCVADLVDRGLEPYEALRALAWLELGRRVGACKRGPEDNVTKPQNVAKLLSYLKHEQKEHFVALILDAKNNVRRTNTIHIGTLTMSIVCPKDVYREVLREGAASVIVAHNHPSGDPTPSPEDVEITAKLVEAGKLLDIPLLDHVIIGDPGYVSLREKGMMP